MRTVSPSVVKSGAVPGKPVGTVSTVRPTFHPRTFSPIVREISQDSAVTLLWPTFTQ